MAAALCLVAACGRRAPTGPLLPERLEAWERKASGEAPPETAPEPLARAAVRRVENAVYQGPGIVHVKVYELTSSAAALDAAQRWRPAPDTVFFYKDNYFTVVQWERADREALTAFVRALEKRLAGITGIQ